MFKDDFRNFASLILFNSSIDKSRSLTVYPGQTKDIADNTHFNPYGAYQIAKCVIEGMKKAVPELAKHLKIDPAYDPAHPDDVNAFRWNESPFTEIEKPDGN